MKDLIIVGAGAFGRELLQWIKDVNKVMSKWTIKGFINDIPDTLEGFNVEASVLSNDNGCTQGKKFVATDPALTRQVSCFH